MAYPNAMYGATGPQPQVSPEVQQWFSAVDRDGSGRITALELKAALANGQGGTFSDTACNLMIGMFDKEKNGTIDIVEFQALYNYINAWLGVFRGFDHDNSGSIQESELNAALTQMGYRLSPEFVSFLIKKSDPNGHSSITIDQFIVLCVQIQRFTEAFRVRDTDQTGSIEIGFEEFLATNDEKKVWNYDPALSHARQAQERIQEFNRLKRARHLLDAISLTNELLADGSDVEILSLAATIIKRFKFLGVFTASFDSVNEGITASIFKPHTGIYHCCTFCSSGGKKEATCGCGGIMPGGYQGCGHGHIGHPGVHHWSCCGSVLHHGPCLVLHRSVHQLLL